MGLGVFVCGLWPSGGFLIFGRRGLDFWSVGFGFLVFGVGIVGRWGCDFW